MSQEEIPEMRIYRHHRCNEETFVDGIHYMGLSDPLSGAKTTWCAYCEEFFPLSEYVWTDTGETIAAYYARHGAKASDMDRFLCSRNFWIIIASVGLLVGAAAGYVLARHQAFLVMIVAIVVAGFVGVVVATAIKAFVIHASILRRVCGVEDTRLLE
jgi:hypothetical protein